jgi:hypothetical protein
MVSIGVLLNRLSERIAGLALRTRRLRERAQSHPHAPVVIVPSVLGTRLVDAGSRTIWGDLRTLYAYTGPPLTHAVAASGLLEGFALLPGLLAYDVFGGLIRFLERIGRYRRNRDLHVLAYDWRAGIAAAAEQLAAHLDRGPANTNVDLVCISTGGLAVRHALTDPARAARVRRVVYVGTPHRGAFSALTYLAEGVRPAPLGRHFSRQEIAALQTTWDALPHPDEHIFVDDDGRTLDIDLYAAETWRRLRLGIGIHDLDDRLARARRLWGALDSTESTRTHPDAFVIGARHLPTLARCIVRGGTAIIPPCAPPRLGRTIPGIYEMGDSGVSLRSLCALPGLAPDRTWFVTPPEHRMLPADRDVHHLVLEALLAPR